MGEKKKEDKIFYLLRNMLLAIFALLLVFVMGNYFITDFITYPADIYCEKKYGLLAPLEFKLHNEWYELPSHEKTELFCDGNQFYCNIENCWGLD